MKIGIKSIYMKKILSIIVGLIFTFTALQAEEKLTIEKQLVGIVGAISGTVKTETRTLEAGDKIPGDAIFLNGENCKSNESGLTGESDDKDKGNPESGWHCYIAYRLMHIGFS